MEIATIIATILGGRNKGGTYTTDAPEGIDYNYTPIVAALIFAAIIIVAALLSRKK